MTQAQSTEIDRVSDNMKGQLCAWCCFCRLHTVDFDATSLTVVKLEDDDLATEEVLG